MKKDTIFHYSQAIAREMEGSKQALSILNEYGKSKLRVSLEYGWSMVRVWLEANILFPRWEQNIPRLGTKHSHAGNKTGLRLVIMLFLMMVVGIGEMKAQTAPVEITTSTSNPKLYLIQSYSNEAYYMRNNSRNDPQTLNTSNIVTTNSEFYFMDGDEIGGTQYYYIVHKETGKYVYMDGTTAKHGNAPASNATDDVKNTYRFKIVKNSSRDAYNIIPINQTKSLNKKNGNSDGADVQLSGVDNDLSCWNFVAKDNYTKPVVPFIPYTANGAKAYYYIQNNKYQTYYLIPGATYVTTDTKTDANEENMMWCFKKAPASDNDPYLDYYYIVHVETGNYLHYRKANNTQNADDAVNLIAYNSSKDNEFLFIIVRGSVSGETHASSATFCIAPMLPRTVRPENTISLCRLQDGDAGSGTVYNNAGVFKERGGNNFVHWNFETAKITCTNPVFTEENGSITLSCETDNTEIYFTENGDDPTADGVTPTKYTNQSWLASSQHRIKAYAKLKNDNTVTTDVVTLFNKPDVTLEAGPYTYKGTAWEPAVTVSVGEGATITTAPTTPTATYNVTYSSDHTNAGTATVTVADADENDNWYIWNPPTATFTIEKAQLTATAEDKAVSYGDAIPTYTATYTGLVNGEADPGFTTNPTFSCAYTPTSAVGSSPLTITVSGGEAQNYTITSYSPGTLTINPAAVTVTADNKEKMYGETDPELTATVTGLKNGDAENVISYTISRAEGEAYGNYTITPSGDAEQGNYTVTYVPGTLTIRRIGVTLTANSGTETYDGTEKTVTGFTCSVEGLEFTNEGITASGSGTNAGLYSVTFNDAVIGKIDNTGNYVVDNAVSGWLTINPRTLTITPKAGQYKGLGEEDPELTYTYLESELVEGDEITFNGALGREVGEDVGNYEINLGTLVSANTNYTLAITAGVYFTIMMSIGNGTIASGFTVEIGEGNSIILKYGETPLEEGTPGGDEKDFIVSDTPPSDRYSSRTVTGKGNYTGYFTIRNAIVNFQTDDNAMEWSATFVAEKSGPTDIGHALPEGVTAYIITAIEGNWAIPEALNYIPEGIPVLLMSDKASGGFEVKDAISENVTLITREGEGNKKDANMLEVRSEIWPDIPAKTIYLLYKNEFVYNMAGDLAAGKVYLNPNHTIPSPSPAPSRLRIKWEDTTGIDNGQQTTDNGLLDDVWYTLDGRKLNGKPTRKGIYIVNGEKKVIRR